MSNTVFNSQIELFGSRYITKAAPIPAGPEFAYESQRKRIYAELFEQLLLFDGIALKVDRQNLPLYFLIKELGINKVEDFFDRGILELVLWTPIIVTSTGRMMPDGTTDHSVVFGVPPLVAGSYSKEDSDPERNIDVLLNLFTGLHEDRKRIFKKFALKHFVLPDNSLAEKSKDIVIDAYSAGRLTSLGLSCTKEPNQLDHIERAKLVGLGGDVLETAFLATKGYKSFGNYSYYNLTSDAVKNIEGALKVSQNTSQILNIQGIADLQSLFLDGHISFDKALDLRDKRSVRQYRKWINGISSSTDIKTISSEYIDEIMGKNKFFESTGGKLIKSVGMFGLGAGIGTVLGGLSGATAGAILGKAADLGLGLFDTYILDGILKGWNPKMFVDELKREKNRATQ